MSNSEFSSPEAARQDGPDLGFWKVGTKIIETCLAKAEAGRPEDAPVPLVGEYAALWHQAQVEAFRHALEMMGFPDNG